MMDWFARPVLHVTDVEASLRFYVDRLGFTSPWVTTRIAERKGRRNTFFRSKLSVTAKTLFPIVGPRFCRKRTLQVDSKIPGPGTARQRKFPTLREGSRSVGDRYRTKRW
jgi:catechol 2,3-dioxygenase-like lactoylglutathione lyase family enzyme